MDNLENFPQCSTARRMLEAVSGNGFYDNSYVGKWLFEVMGLELEDAAHRFEELRLQIFPETATWGAVYHEKKYGLSGGGSQEERRERVLKKRSSFMPFNPAVVAQRLSAISGIREDCIEIMENTAPYTFRLLFHDGEEELPDYGALKILLNQIKPSHLHMDMGRLYRCGLSLSPAVRGSLGFGCVFYARFNLPPLYLSQDWRLDGERLLNGFQSDHPIEFYPVRLFLNSRAVQRNHYRNRLYAGPVAAVQRYRPGARWKIRTGAEKTGTLGGRTGVTGRAELSPGCDGAVAIEKDLWHLNGTKPLDGSKLLDASEEKYPL